MRRAYVNAVILLSCSACGDGAQGVDLCEQSPPPPECMVACDPTPGAPNTCPSGFHCSPDGMCQAQCTPGGGECGSGYECSADGRCISEGACDNLECQQVDCAAMGMPETTVSGTVFAPNGTLPLYGINVYVPNADPGPLPGGAQCATCDQALPGSPVVQTATDEAGNFVLSNVPAGDDIPLVITSGKWRRQITIPTVAACALTTLDAAETRLPATSAEGDIPHIALSTGGADALECLLRKLGIDDSEITTDGQNGRVHLYANVSSGGVGADQFEGGFGGGSGDFADSQDLWGSVAKLSEYDIVIFSCEGGQYPDTKSQQHMDNVKAYADLGGRLFMSHWHNIWIEGGGFEGASQEPAVWTEIANWNNSSTTFTGTDTIDEVSNPKGGSFATWMLNVMGSTVRGEIPILNDSGKNTCESINGGRAERWVYWTDGGTEYPQNFQFTTPNENPLEDRCGKVVFSDMHVSGDSTSSPGGPGYPSECSTDPLTPQEKALAFMLFDLASCVEIIP
jgi:hypothetical protein